MNIKLAAPAAAAAAALPLALAATSASASTSGCMTAPFRCGTFVQAATNGNAIARLGWSASAGTAGSPVVEAPDLATSPRSDFRVVTRDGDTRIEYAPRGKRSGLYVAVNVIGAYRKGGVVVKPGGLVLAGWNASWAERWAVKPVRGGVVLVNDYSGAVVVPGKAGADIGTEVRVRPGVAALEFLGNGN